MDRVQLTFILLTQVFLFVLSETVQEPVNDTPDKTEEEPWLGLLDYALLALLGVGGAYYFFSKKEEPQIPAYKIQPTLMPQQSTSDKGFISKMKNSKRRMVVFYGSQTGTAEEFAGRLAKEGARYGMKGLVADPEECDMEDLPRISELEDDLGDCLAVFCVATYGEGDPTDNAQEFFDWLQAGENEVSGEQQVERGKWELPILTGEERIIVFSITLFLVSLPEPLCLASDRSYVTHMLLETKNFLFNCSTFLCSQLCMQYVFLSCLVRDISFNHGRKINTIRFDEAKIFPRTSLSFEGTVLHVTA